MRTERAHHGVFDIAHPAAPSPLVVDSPHSGRDYPEDFRHVCPRFALRQAEDFLVDELVAGAAQAGATLISARFPRSYIDVNRAENDIDEALLAEPWPMPLAPSSHTPQGLGLVRRLCRTGQPVYEAPLAVEDVQRRIERYHRPYHRALADALAACHRRFGACYLIDAHSMPDAEGRADFVLGDRHGASCDPAFAALAREWLRGEGYSVALNDPYGGMEIVRRYGAPARGMHALQIEINRRLYMDESRLEKTAGFEPLRKALSRFFEALAARLAGGGAERLAAE